MITPTRRSFIRSAALLFAAPAIVKASSLMPVRAFIGDGVALKSIQHPWSTETWRVGFGGPATITIEGVDQYGRHFKETTELNLDQLKGQS